MKEVEIDQRKRKSTSSRTCWAAKGYGGWDPWQCEHDCLRLISIRETARGDFKFI